MLAVGFCGGKYFSQHLGPGTIVIHAFQLPHRYHDLIEIFSGWRESQHRLVRINMTVKARPGILTKTDSRLISRLKPEPLDINPFRKASTVAVRKYIRLHGTYTA
jgi:hypothetical protein